MDEVKKVEEERVMPPVNVVAAPIVQAPKPVEAPVVEVSKPLAKEMTVAEATAALSKAKADEVQNKIKRTAEAAALKRKDTAVSGLSAADKEQIIADKTAAAKEREIAETKKLDSMYREESWTIINYICKTCGRASTSVAGVRKHVRTHL